MFLYISPTMAAAGGDDNSREQHWHPASVEWPEIRVDVRNEDR